MFNGTEILSGFSGFSQRERYECQVASLLCIFNKYLFCVLNYWVKRDTVVQHNYVTDPTTSRVNSLGIIAYFYHESS